jgi:hypothetical protein
VQFHLIYMEWKHHQSQEFQPLQLPFQSACSRLETTQPKNMIEDEKYQRLLWYQWL